MIAEGRGGGEIPAFALFPLHTDRHHQSGRARRAIDHPRVPRVVSTGQPATVAEDGGRAGRGEGAAEAQEGKSTWRENRRGQGGHKRGQGGEEGGSLRGAAPLGVCGWLLFSPSTNVVLNPPLCLRCVVDYAQPDLVSRSARSIYGWAHLRRPLRPCWCWRVPPRQRRRRQWGRGAGVSSPTP